MYYDKLRKDLFVDIDYPEEITSLIGEAEPWRAFTTLARETKEQFHFRGHQHDTDPGYCHRSKAEGREDKEYFHIYPDTHELIEADGLTALVESTPELKSFFTYSAEVYKAAFDFAIKIGRDMGKEIPELGALIEEGKIKMTLRLLHYTNDESVDIIAAQHFDRSLYTLHLYESGPGLQFLNWDMQWTEAPIAAGKTVVFTGYRLEQLTGGKLQKTWHRVAREGAVRDRLSMVLFVWSPDVPDYDREGRSQDLAPSYTKI